MKRRTTRKLLAVAAVCAIAGLVMMVWSLFSSSPLVLVAAMSIGQGIGTLSFVLYIAVVVVDLWQRTPAHDDAPDDDAPDDAGAGEEAAEPS